MSRQKHRRTESKRRAKAPTAFRVPTNETSYPDQPAQDTTQPAASIPTPASPSLKWPVRSKVKRSRVYALLYLFSIPAFAFFYYFLPPKHFYHSTINYENSVSDELEFILDGLKKSMIITFNEVQHNSVVEVNGRRVNINDLTIKDLKVFDSSFSFKVSIPFQREIKKEDWERFGNALKKISELTNNKSVKIMPLPKQWNPIYLKLSVEISLGNVVDIQLDSSERVPVKDAKIKEISIPEGFTNPGDSIGEKEIKNMFFDRYIPLDELNNPNKPLEDRMEHGILLRSNISEALINYGNASQGFPSKIKGNFIRMFYLSAVTITTLGYGDIVPITQEARLLVSLEAIFGVVTIGFFLNALSNEIKK